MVHTILTHPGGAHKDDLLAVCVLIAEHGAPVVRREPTASELSDAGVAIVDVGGQHEPALNNFDHHHFDREHPPTCALSLVLDGMGMYEDARHFCDWLEPAEWFDSRGPNKTAKWLGVPRRAISQLNSPIDVTLLRRFAAQTELQPGHTLYEYMRFVGQDLLDYLRVARERIDFVAAHAQRWQVSSGDDVIEAVFLPRTDPPPTSRVPPWPTTCGRWSWSKPWQPSYIPTAVPAATVSAGTKTTPAWISPGWKASRTCTSRTRAASCARPQPRRPSACGA